MSTEFVIINMQRKPSFASTNSYFSVSCRLPFTSACLHVWIMSSFSPGLDVLHLVFVPDKRSEFLLIGFRETYTVLCIFPIALDVFGRSLSSSPPFCPPQCLSSPVHVCMSGMLPFLAIVQLDRLLLQSSPEFSISVRSDEFGNGNLLGGRLLSQKAASWEFNTRLFHVTNLVYHRVDYQHLPSFTGVSVLGNILQNEIGIHPRISSRQRTLFTI